MNAQAVSRAKVGLVASSVVACRRTTVAGSSLKALFILLHASLLAKSSASRNSASSCRVSELRRPVARKCASIALRVPDWSTMLARRSRISQCAASNVGCSLLALVRSASVTASESETNLAKTRLGLDPASMALSTISARRLARQVFSAKAAAVPSSPRTRGNNSGRYASGSTYRPATYAQSRTPWEISSWSASDTSVLITWCSSMVMCSSQYIRIATRSLIA
mmetsp:Transcript_21834/g.69739  ORF Transcript_21834/g.69739 Transcript_21834/m.69739 type:complete len:223 (+) Transcript_21834:547-1215(+)